MQPTPTESKPTGTLVLLTPDERERLRIKRQEAADFIGIRNLPLSAFLRWAALNIDIKRDTSAITREMEAV